MEEFDLEKQLEAKLNEVMREDSKPAQVKPPVEVKRPVEPERPLRTKPTESERPLRVQPAETKEPSDDVKLRDSEPVDLSDAKLPDEDEPKKKKIKKRYIVIAAVLACFIGCYIVFIYSGSAFVKKWRTIYIETAMSTNSHQWLATWFIPADVIAEVMEEKERAFALQRGLESKWDNEEAESTASPSPSPTPIDPLDEFFGVYWELDSKSIKNYLKSKSIDTKEELDNLKIDNLNFDKELYTKKKDKVLVVDVKNSTMIVGVEGSTYVGKLAIVKDPSLVCVGRATHLPNRGDIINEFGENNDAFLAINASGFVDKGGHGSGGSVRGSLVIDGVDYGSPEYGDFKFFGMKKKNNHFYIETPGNVDVKKYRWGVQFFPALIVDGECVVAGTYGLGIQPRTTVGQSKDGTFYMLIVDGRQVGYSLGCTMEECANQLIKYKVYQAANLDGGSSSIMWYNGEHITRSSSPSGFGRYLPDALYVKKVH